MLVRACLALLAVAASGQTKKPVTAQVAGSYKAPGAPEVVWSPEGKRFVWVDDDRVWLYDVNTRARQELLTLKQMEKAATPMPAQPNSWENRHVREDQVQWLPSGRELLVSAGGDLFLFRLNAVGWQNLTSTSVPEHDPKVSPDGRFLAFRRAHDLYVLEFATLKLTRLTSDGSPTLLNGEMDWVYPEELELDTAYWWAPDSSRIAYLQFDVSREQIYPHADLAGPDPVAEPQRYPRAGSPNAEVHMGVVPVTGGRTVWMDLGLTPDTLLARAVWLPDSTRVAALRMNRVQTQMVLLAADARTGRSTQLLEESDPYWVEPLDALRFLKEGREFLWLSSRSGFRHLYRYSADGKPIAQITRGDWDVAKVEGVNEARGEVYFSARRESPVQMQFYKADLSGKQITQITRVPGWHTVSLNPAAEYFLDTASSLKNPPETLVRTGTGGEWSTLLPRDRKLDDYALLTPEILTVKAPDGALLYARLLKPAGFAPGKKYPAVVLVYGGPGAQTVTDEWAGANLEQVLAQRGFVVWQLDGRGSTGRGHKWESVLKGGLGLHELADQKLGVQHLISLGFVDPARVGIQGWSYGGFMTLYSLLNAPETFATGAAGAPVTDQRNYDTIYTERYLGLPSENPEAYKRSSVVHEAAKLKAPLLLMHNFEDDNVLYMHTVQMARALELAGKQFQMVLYTQKTHGVSGPEKGHLYEAIASFFEQRLR